MTLGSSSKSTQQNDSSSIVSVSHPQFTRNASCPTQGTLSSTMNSLLIEKKYSSSSNTLHTYFNQINQRSNTIPSHHSTIIENKNFLQKMKTRVVNLFKHIKYGNSINNTDNQMDINQQQQQQSTFNYDPELDLREEHLLLVSKRLLTTLRETRQCLIMSAEEPFGIMGAQIKIKLTLLSPNMTTTITKYLPIIQINSKQKTTFEIEIDLHEDTKVFTLRHFLPKMKMFQQIKERSPLYVSPRCLLIKNVFYKTAEPKRAYVNSS
ncbi:unnamed protein product [Rotaria sordida]|uniref:Uncharacterized protein n=1 Tax=Rotaria sordida TaxID=392033 RepID=A0A813SZX9_9BILA|nr:unnamed protein product [Rotaria sordida]